MVHFNSHVLCYLLLYMVVVILFDASPSQVPSDHCWYSFAAEFIDANLGK